MLDYRNDVRLERWDAVQSRGFPEILRGTMQPNFKSGVVGSRYELFEESLPANPLALPTWLLADGMLVCTLLISTFNEDPRSCVRFFSGLHPGCPTAKPVVAVACLQLVIGCCVCAPVDSMDGRQRRSCSRGGFGGTLFSVRIY